MRLSRRCYGRGATVTVMDLVAIFTAIVAFALLLILIEGLNRV
jgi:hypothetical protein